MTKSSNNVAGPASRISRFLRGRQVPAFLGPHRQDSLILVGFLVVAIALFGFVKLASEVVEGDTTAFDKQVLRSLRTAADPGVPIGPGWLKTAMVDFTALGGVAVLTLITALAVGYLLASRKRATAGFVILSVAGGAILSAGIKSLFLRARPEIVPHLVDVTSASFPSGHAMNSSIVYLTLAVLLARAEDRRSIQLYLITIAIVLALLIGTTRVYLGVHWPTDVLAGWSVGAIWAAFCSLVAKQLQRRRKIEGPEEQPPAPPNP